MPTRVAEREGADPLALANRGIALREKGDLSAAEEVFLSLTRDHPDKPYGWQELSVIYSLDGRKEKALEFSRKAVEVCPDDITPRTHLYLNLVALDLSAEADKVFADFATDSQEHREAIALMKAKQGIALREKGDLDAAEAILLSLTRDYPHKPYGWQEMSVLRAKTHRWQEALEYARTAVGVRPKDILPRIYCFLHLTALGRHFEAEQVFDDFVPNSLQQNDEIEHVREVSAYVQRWPREMALAMANDLETSGRFIDVAGVEARILSAVARGRPFSLIRIGDGEGSWFKLDAADEGAYPRLYAKNRKEFLRIWFADDSHHDRPAFHAVAADMMSATGQADILGVPYSLRVANEYWSFSRRGIPSTMNLLRGIATFPDNPSRSMCSQDIHLELHNAGFFRRLFGLDCEFGVISCHAGLPDLIRDRTNARVDRVHLTPEEKGFSGVLGPNGVSKPHFPDVYDQIVANLRGASQQGVVWIVAAGVLGKIYCAEIRRNRGIALDVGSIVDGWMGKVTRPTLRDVDRFAL